MSRNSALFVVFINEYRVLTALSEAVKNKEATKQKGEISEFILKEVLGFILRSDLITNTMLGSRNPFMTLNN